MRSHTSSHFLRDLLNHVRLDAVADLKIAEAVNAYAALHAGAHLVHVILEAAQGIENAFVDQVFATHDTDLALDYASVADNAAGHLAALGQFENLFDLGAANDIFLEHRIEQAGHGLFHLIDQLIDDRVKLDLHAFPLGHIGHADIQARMETDNDRVGGGSQMHVRFGNRPDSAVNEFDGNFFGVELLQGLHDGLDG